MNKIKFFKVKFDPNFHKIIFFASLTSVIHSYLFIHNMPVLLIEMELLYIHPMQGPQLDLTRKPF